MNTPVQADMDDRAVLVKAVSELYVWIYEELDADPGPIQDYLSLHADELVRLQLILDKPEWFQEDPGLVLVETGDRL